MQSRHIEECTMNKDIFIGFCIGISLGAGAALLFAPESGEQLRQGIKDKTDKSTQYLGQFGEKLKKRAEVGVQTGRKEVTRVVSQVKEQLDDAVKAGRQAYTSALQADTTADAQV